MTDNKIGEIICQVIDIGTFLTRYNGLQITMLNAIMIPLETGPQSPNCGELNNNAEPHIRVFRRSKAQPFLGQFV